MKSLTPYDKVLLENGMGELCSPNFLVMEGDPVILTLTSNSDKIPPNAFIRIQILHDDQFINYSLPEQGYKFLKRDVKHIKLVNPGEYRVYRPDLTRQDIELGVAMRTSKILPDDTSLSTPSPTTSPTASHTPSPMALITESPSPSPTPHVSPTGTPTPTPTPSVSLKIIDPLVFKEMRDSYSIRARKSVDIPIKSSIPASFSIWYGELPSGLTLTETGIRGKCYIPGKYEIGLEASSGGQFDQILIDIIVE